MEQRLDRSVRSGVWAIAITALALVAAELVSSAWAIWSLWLLAALATLIALWNANAGRRHVTTHPDRYAGLPLAVLTMVFGVAAALVIASSVYASVRTAPAADAPSALSRQRHDASGG
ncbi:MAG: hypothetical protein R2702_18020 [Acidimicrobiales bacterium]